MNSDEKLRLLRSDVDLFAAVQEKMVLNREKYPAEQVRGDARKYHEYKK